jgi:triosephosphate isomerase
VRRRRPLFAANWKMHKGPPEARAFAESFVDLCPARDDRSVAVFPPSISLVDLRKALNGRPDIEVGIQDVHAERQGAHTGAISAPMAAEAGATWGLAGHSERRREFGDDDAAVAAKTKRLLEAGLQPVLCVGETLEEREAGQLEAVLARQVGDVLAAIDPGDHGRLRYAYEPVWAIGTGRTAQPEDAAEAHGIVRSEIERRSGREVAEAAIILYGGSVKPSNIAVLMAADGVDGVLVGGASLDPESFARICRVPLE